MFRHPLNSSFVVTTCPLIRAPAPHALSLLPMQFGHVVPADWCYRLEQKNLHVDRLWEMDHKEISALIRQNNSGLMIQKFVGQFPWLDIKVFTCKFMHVYCVCVCLCA